MTPKKMGRPTNSPKTIQITIRFELSQMQILAAYCQKNNVTKVEAIRRAVMALEEKE